MTEAIKAAFSSLSDIFRHVVPGALAIASLYISFPSAFDKFQVENSAHIWLLIGLSLVIGNMVYVLHRTILHQAIDFFVWAISHAKSEDYIERIANMVKGHFTLPEEPRRSMHLRNSQVILTAIFGELMIVSSHYHSPDSFAASHSCALLWWGLLCWFGSIGAHFVSQKTALAISPWPKA